MAVKDLMLVYLRYQVNMVTGRKDFSQSELPKRANSHFNCYYDDLHLLKKRPLAGPLLI